eukprot:scaffold22795_cov63-Skeletonema_menzelii.AAC.1
MRIDIDEAVSCRRCCRCNAFRMFVSSIMIQNVALLDNNWRCYYVDIRLQCTVIRDASNN